MPLDDLPLLLSAAQASRLRSALERVGYSEWGLGERIDVLALPIIVSRYYPASFPGKNEPIDRAIRFFMIGAHEDEGGLVEAIGREVLQDLLDCKMARRESAGIRATVILRPWAGFYFATDRVDGVADPSHVIAPEQSAAGLAMRSLEVADRAPARVLDIGTGTGALALIASRFGKEIVGVDVNPRAVELARFNASLNEVGSLRFECCSCEDIPSRDFGGAFDLVLFNFPGSFELNELSAVAYSEPDGKRLLAGAYRSLVALLAPGGRALLRHEIPADETFMPELLGVVDPERRLHVEHVVAPHAQGLRDLRTVQAVVRHREASEPQYAARPAVEV